MAQGNGECKRQHAEWIDAEERTPNGIGDKVIIYQKRYGEFRFATYDGEGYYRVNDHKWIKGESIDCWMAIPDPPEWV